MPKNHPVILPRDRARLKRFRVSRGTRQAWVKRRMHARLHKAGGDAFIVRLLAAVFGGRDDSFSPGTGRFCAACIAIEQRKDIAPIAAIRMVERGLITPAASTGTFKITLLGREIVDDFLGVVRGTDDVIDPAAWVEGA